MKYFITIMFITIMLLAFNIIAAKVNSEPEVLIPKINFVPTGNPETWKSASTLRIFTTDGRHRQIPEATTLYLAHDNKNLYAGWICRDSKGSGIAYPLKPTDDLKLNETVQIVIGLTDGAPRLTKLTMGGYEGASSKKLNIKHYYEFSANAVGAVSRTYNESPLPNPRFRAVVKPLPDKKGFQVIMTIPLSSAGLQEGKRMIYFNAFRFFRSTRYGWYLPKFGGFVSMPFGRALLATAKDNMPCKHEKVSPVKKKKRKESLPTTKPAQLSIVKFTYYPIYRKLCAVFPPDSKSRVAFVKFGTLEKRKKLNNRTPSVILLQIPELPSNKVQIAEIGIGSKNKRKKFTPQEKPDWMGTKPGMQYVSGRVPFPWMPPKWDDKKIELKHCEIDFAQTVLPSQITVKKQPILAAPIKMEFRFRGKKSQTLMGRPKKMTSTPDRVDLHSLSNNHIEMRNMVDYDGFMVVRLRFKQSDARRLEKLTLTIPLMPGIAKFVNHGHTQKVIRLNQYGYNSDGRNIWVGNQNAGLSFSSDRRVWFSEPNDKQIILKKRSDGGTDLKLNLVTAAGQVPDKEQVFQFFLLPTPTRAKMPPPMRDKMALWFENWSDYQGYPDLKKLPAIRKRVQKVQKKGQLLYMYFSQVLAIDAPGAKKYGVEWFAPPRRPWYKRAYNPGKGVPCVVSCFRGAAGELLLNGIERMVKECGISGVYLDGPSFPFGCTNPSHLCDDSLPVIFDDNVQHGRVIGQRQFLKRMRGLFDLAGVRYPFWVHTGGGLDLPTLSLCDFYYDGETLVRFPKRTMVPQDTFMVAYSGRPFGFRGIFLPLLFNDATGNTPALPWTIVHGIESSWAGNAQNVFFSLPRTDKTARFFPYYEKQPHIKRLNHTDVAISYYLGAKGAILAASNLHYNGTQKVELNVSGLLKNAKFIEDLSSDEPLDLKDGVLYFKVPEARIRLFRFSSKASVKPAPIKAVGIKLDSNPKWQLKHSYPPSKVTDTSWPTALYSKPGYPMAEAVLDAELPEEFTASFELKHRVPMRIKLDKLALTLNSKWKLSGSNLLDYRSSCLAYGGNHKAVGKDIKVQLGVKNGRLSLVYDGHMLLDQIRLAKPRAPYRLSILTWGGGKLFLKPCRIKPQFTLKSVKKNHPIR